MIFHAGVQYIYHPLDAHVQDQIGLGVEEFSSVDEGEMAQTVHAFCCALNFLGIPYIALYKLDIPLDVF